MQTSPCSSCPLACNRRQASHLPPRESAPSGAASSATPPDFILRNDHGFWQLTTQNQTAVLPQHHAWFFISILLTDPDSQPHSIRDLARKVFTKYSAHPDFLHGGPLWLRMHTDESELAQILQLREHALERLLARDHELDIIKNEAIRELETIYELQAQLPFLAQANTEDYARLLLESLQGLQSSLALAVDRTGTPHELCRRFADHLFTNILLPSLLTTDPFGNPQFVHLRPSSSSSKNDELRTSHNESIANPS